LEAAAAEAEEEEEEEEWAGPIKGLAAVAAGRWGRSHTHIPIDGTSAAPSASPGCDPGSRPNKAVHLSLRGFLDPCSYQKNNTTFMRIP